jgi:hypothetical protein
MVDHALHRYVLRPVVIGSLLLAVGGPGAGLLGGCSSDTQTAASGRRLAAGDFVTPVAGEKRAASRLYAAPRGGVEARVVSAAEARSGDVVGEGTGDAGTPAETAPQDGTADEALPPITPRTVVAADGTLLVDAKVGDLNGSPIFAAEWLEPISGRLRAESARLERDAWRNFAGGLIRERLAAELKDELLYNEIQNELTPEEKAGVRQVISNAQREQIRRTGGSVTLAERQLQDANNQTIDSFARDRERQILVAEKYRREIDERVQVSQRDIELYYERNHDQFNPPPIAHLHRIRLGKDDAASIAQVQQRLGAGEPFIDVATIESNTMTQALTAREIIGPYEEFEFYSIEPLNEATRSLKPGQTVGPVEHGTSVSWLYLEKIEDRAVTLYDAQLAIENQLRSDQRRELEQRYIFRLIRRAGLAEFDRIVIGLTEIAEQWYYAGPGDEVARGSPGP